MNILSKHSWTVNMGQSCSLRFGHDTNNLKETVIVMNGTTVPLTSEGACPVPKQQDGTVALQTFVNIVTIS
jgi:hypothetical protein